MSGVVPKSPHRHVVMPMVSLDEGKCFLLRYGTKLRRGHARLVLMPSMRPSDPEKPAQEFSGGNQQKLVLGRALSRARKIFILCEPTAGIDVGARLDFYRQMERLCQQGAAILLISSDLQEQTPSAIAATPLAATVSASAVAYALSRSFVVQRRPRDRSRCVVDLRVGCHFGTPPPRRKLCIGKRAN
jgi:ABC-type Mn2+/Zn2+ transport system ATPase subunit